jgi:hypothetical protein
MSDVRGKSATAMSRTKKPSKLSADERAFLNRICSLNEETEKLTFEELIAYFNIMHKIDPRSVRHAFEETFIDPRINQLRRSSAARGRERAREMEAIAGRLCRAERPSRALHGLGVRPL